MPLPTLKVQIAFTSAPLATPTWVDVSPYVRLSPAVSIRRGNLSADPQGHDSAGSLRFVLDNRLRRFDWTYAAGPYYGQLTPRKQVRVLATHGGVDYPLFYGWTSGFRCEVGEMGKDATCTVEAYDAIGALAGGRLNADPLEEYIDSIAAPTAWWRAVDASRMTDRQGAYTALSSGKIGVRSASSLRPGLKSNALLMDGTGGWSKITPAISRNLTQTYQVSFWITTTAVSQKFLHGPDGCPATGIDASGRIALTVGASTNMSSSVVINDGFPHFVYYYRAGGAPLSGVMYIDGVLDAAVGLVSNDGTFTFDTIGASYSISSTKPDVFATGVIIQDLQIAIQPTPWTAEQVAYIYDLARDVIVESTGTRVGRILDEASWPTGWRDISTATRGECGPLGFNGQSILTGLHQAERTEQGRMYAALGGKVTFRHRYYAYEDTVSAVAQVTFSDDGANESYRSFGHRRGDEDVVNDVTVTNGSSQSRSIDSTSQTAYDTVANTYDTVLSDFAQIDSMADGLIYLYKDARIRLDPIDLQNSATSWPDVLGLELADRIRIESTPLAVGPQMVAEVLVESVQWSISSEWKFTVAGSPVPPVAATEGFWTLDVSELDAGTVLAF